MQDNGFEPQLIVALISVIIGWLLGLLAPAITEKIRRSYRIQDLKTAITAELHELQYKMAAVSYNLNSYNDQLTDEFLNWFESIVLKYSGEEPVERLREVLPSLRKIPQSSRHAISYPNGTEGRGLGLMQYTLPSLNAHINEIAIMPISFQAWTLQITNKLNMFNQRVVGLNKKMAATFDSSLSDQNRTIIENELSKGYIEIAKQAKTIADLISRGESK